jgi:hypothetical protein
MLIAASVTRQDVGTSLDLNLELTYTFYFKRFQFPCSYTQELSQNITKASYLKDHIQALGPIFKDSKIAYNCQYARQQA